MLQRFPYLLRTGKKLLEIAGAGCASALVAFLLGNSHEQPTSAAAATNAPAVVRLAPADEEMIRAVRQESASLVAHLRTGAQGPTAGTAAVGTVPAGAAVAATSPKSAKTPPPAQARREAKATRAAVPESKPRAPEPVPAASAIQAPVAPSPRPQGTANIEVNESRVAQASTSQADSAQVLFTPISTWFSDVPRPPVGIGEDPSRSM
jgi:hypothetical protein